MAEQNDNWGWLKDLGTGLWEGAKDYASDGDNWGDWIERLLFENPGMTVDELLEVAATTNRMNNPNTNNPFGNTQITYDENNMPTDINQNMAPGVLNLVNAMGRRMASGKVESFQTPQGVLDAGTAAINKQQVANGQEPTPQDWFEPYDREATEWIDLVNPSGYQGGNASQGATGGSSAPTEGRDPGIGNGGGSFVRGSSGGVRPSIPGTGEAGGHTSPGTPDQGGSMIDERQRELSDALGSDFIAWLANNTTNDGFDWGSLKGPVDLFLEVGEQAFEAALDKYCAAHECDPFVRAAYKEEIKALAEAQTRDMSDDLGTADGQGGRGGGGVPLGYGRLWGWGLFGSAGGSTSGRVGVTGVEEMPPPPMPDE